MFQLLYAAVFPIFWASVHFPFVSPKSSEKDYLVRMYVRLDSVITEKYLDSYLADNSAGAYAWALSYLADSYLIMFKVLKDEVYLEKFQKIAEIILDKNDARRRMPDYAGRIRWGWSATKYSKDKSRMVHFVHTGMILYPILKFCTMKSEWEKLSDAKNYNKLKDDILETAKNCISEFENQWVFNNYTGEGYYMWEGNEPLTANLTYEPPLNGQAAMGKSLALLYRLTGEKFYLKKVQAILQYYIHHVTATRAGGLLWGYRADLTRFKTPEDISHGAIEVEFALEAIRLGLLEKEFARKLAMTLLSLKKDNGFAQYLDGSEKYASDADREMYSLQAGRWLGLCAWDCRVYDAVYSYYLSVLPSKKFVHPSGLLGVAYLIDGFDTCRKK